MLQNTHFLFFIFFYFSVLGGLRAFMIKIWPFNFWQLLKGHLSALLALLSIFIMILIEHLKAFIDSDWANPSVFRNLWMSSFQNTWQNEIPMDGSKVMASRRKPTRLARFSRYLNRFNSNSDPWIVIGKGIQ